MIIYVKEQRTNILYVRLQCDQQESNTVTQKSTVYFKKMRTLIYSRNGKAIGKSLMTPGFFSFCQTEIKMFKCRSTEQRIRTKRREGNAIEWCLIRHMCLKTISGKFGKIGFKRDRDGFPCSKSGSGLESRTLLQRDRDRDGFRSSGT